MLKTVDITAYGKSAYSFKSGSEIDFDDAKTDEIAYITVYNHGQRYRWTTSMNFYTYPDEWVSGKNRISYTPVPNDGTLNPMYVMTNIRYTAAYRRAQSQLQSVPIRLEIIHL